MIAKNGGGTGSSEKKSKISPTALGASGGGTTTGLFLSVIQNIN